MKRKLTQSLGAALVVATFGGAWACYGVYALASSTLPLLVAVPLALTIILTLVLTKYQRRIEKMPDERLTLAEQDRDERGRRAFMIVNVVMLSAILLSVRVWYGLHHVEYLAPTISLIVGLHFFALAGPSEMPAYRVVGAALGVVALMATLAVPSPPWHGAIVGLGNAAILWACYVLRLRAVMRAI